MNRRQFVHGSLGSMFIAPVGPPGRMLLVPAYFYPEAKGLKEWDRLIVAGRKATVVTIANPASGPG